MAYSAGSLLALLFARKPVSAPDWHDLFALTLSCRRDAQRIAS
jgi:hypothetical protein